MSIIDRRIIEKVSTGYMQRAMKLTTDESEEKIVLETLVILLNKLVVSLGKNKLTVDTALDTLDILIEKAQEIEKDLKEEFERVNI